MLTIPIDSSLPASKLAAIGRYAHVNPNIERNIPFEAPDSVRAIEVVPIKLKVTDEERILPSMRKRGLRHATPYELLACGARHYEALRAELGDYWTLISFGTVKTFPRGERCVLMIGANFQEEYMAVEGHRPSSLDLYWPIKDPMWIRGVHFLGVRTS